MKKLFIAATLFAFLPGMAFGEWKVVKENSSVGFTAYSRMHNADGVFHRWDFTGRVNDNWSGSGKITIDIASIDTQEPKRDRHLQNEDFFNAPRFPHATFEIKSMKAVGDRVEISGNLSIMGKTGPLTMTLKKTESGNTATLEGQTDINRSEFGVTGNSNFNPIQDRVTLKVKIGLRK